MSLMHAYPASVLGTHDQVAKRKAMQTTITTHDDLWCFISDYYTVRKQLIKRTDKGRLILKSRTEIAKEFQAWLDAHPEAVVEALALFPPLGHASGNHILRLEKQYFPEVAALRDRRVDNEEERQRLLGELSNSGEEEQRQQEPIRRERGQLRL